MKLKLRLRLEGGEVGLGWKGGGRLRLRLEGVGGSSATSL